MPHRVLRRAAVAGLFLFSACADDTTDTAVDASVPIRGEGAFDPGRLEAERLDPAWRAWADRDRVARSGRTGSTSDRRADAARGATETSGAGVADTAAAESFEDITPLAANLGARLPIRPEGGGPSVLRAQVLLDRARFSPGVIDGRWGKNTEKAVYWFQDRHGLRPTGRIDAATYRRLASAGGANDVVVRHVVTEDQVDGPFVSIPENVYDKSELDCLCYESAVELLAEAFHTTPEVLEQLNPDMALDGVQAGDSLWVPGVRDAPPATGVARVVISRKGFYTQALDAAGNVILHFPSTLGSGYDPSPTGDLSVTSVRFDPHFHYQPELFHEVPDEEPTAMLPPGPNSPVGVVWMQLSKPHYGIHGTSEPETIGYTSSHGCVRLTNWDARTLGRSVDVGTRVEFR